VHFVGTDNLNLVNAFASRQVISGDGGVDISNGNVV
jgi:hypothetical protein